MIINRWQLVELTNDCITIRYMTIVLDQPLLPLDLLIISRRFDSMNDNIMRNLRAVQAALITACTQLPRSSKHWAAEWSIPTSARQVAILVEARMDWRVSDHSKGLRIQVALPPACSPWISMAKTSPMRMETVLSDYEHRLAEYSIEVPDYLPCVPLKAFARQVIKERLGPVVALHIFKLKLKQTQQNYVRINAQRWRQLWIRS